MQRFAALPAFSVHVPENEHHELLSVQHLKKTDAAVGLAGSPRVVMPALLPSATKSFIWFFQDLISIWKGQRGGDVLQVRCDVG